MRDKAIASSRDNFHKNPTFTGSFFDDPPGGFFILRSDNRESNPDSFKVI